METSPNKRQRGNKPQGKKKGNKALARLRSLKEATGECEDFYNRQAMNGANDRGVKDVRTLTEKMKILLWVSPSTLTRPDV